jgi:hypothetical protein
MRRFLPACLILVAGSGVGVAAPPDGPGVHRNAFERGGCRYEIRAVAVDASLGFSSGQRIAYTVRRDGKFVHPNDPDGGRLVGCRYAIHDPLDLYLAPFPDAEQPVGWVMSTGARCGNGFEQRVRLVIPPNPENSTSDGYVEATFVAKFGVRFRRTEAGIEVWSSRQVWGNGGTSSSVVVPECRLVDGQGDVRSAPLDPDWRTWGLPEDEPVCFPTVYLAGLFEGNVALMRRALSSLHVPEFSGWCTQFGLPADREGLRELCDAVEARAAADERVRDLAPALGGP